MKSEVELVTGMRVSVEIPDQGTCVAAVKRMDAPEMELSLLDDVPDGTLQVGTTVDMFAPRAAGLLRWRAEITSKQAPDIINLVLLGDRRLIQRRSNPRVDVDLPAEIRHIRSGRRGKPGDARIADLSRGGMKLIGGTRVAPADTVEVTVDLGTGKVSLTGRVVMARRSVEGEDVIHLAFAEELTGVLGTIDAYVASRL